MMLTTTGGLDLKGTTSTTFQIGTSLTSPNDVVFYNSNGVISVVDKELVNYRSLELLNLTAYGTITAVNLSGTNTGNETIASITTIVNSTPLAPNITDTDFIQVAASSGLGRTSLTQFKAILKSFFDGLYQVALGFTPENTANKSDSFTASSTVTFASTKALVDGLASVGGGGGITGFTTSINTTAPNNIVNVSTLSSSASTTDADVLISPKGTGAFILGVAPDGTTVGGNKRGTNAIDFGRARSAATAVVSGFNSVNLSSTGATITGQYSINCGPGDNTISGSYSVNCGSVSTIHGSYSCNAGAVGYISADYCFNGGYGGMVYGVGSANIGYSGYVSGAYAFNCGHGARVTADYGVNTGASGLADVIGKFTHGGGSEAVRGDAQMGFLVCRNRTTNATTTSLTSDSSTTRTTMNILVVRDSASYDIQVRVVARQTSTGVTKIWSLEAGAKLVGTTTLTLGAVSNNVIYTDTGSETWTATLLADTTNGGVYVSVVGQTSKNIQWVARMATVEVAY